MTALAFPYTVFSTQRKMNDRAERYTSLTAVKSLSIHVNIPIQIIA